MSEVETLVVGAGQAGLAVSYHLGRLGCEHLVLERHEVGSTWRRERWDSFALVTQNWQLRLPGFAYAGDEPEGFLTREGVIRHLDAYAASFRPPVACGVEVRRVLAAPSGAGYVVEAEGARYRAANVVLANGAFPLPEVPALSARLPAGVHQLHATGYRNPRALPDGAVLVVGSGQSGTQIARELALSGRRVYLSVGSSGKVLRRYRGQDITHWVQRSGQYDRTIDELVAAGQRPQKNPHIGIDLPALARQTELVLLGRLAGVEGGVAHFAPDLNARLRAWDDDVARLRRQIDEFIAAEGLSAPVEPSPPPTEPLPEVTRLDLGAEGVAAVIWATGYRFDRSLVPLPVWGPDGAPEHRRGVTALPGLYFLGLHYLHTLKSGLLFGVGDDAAYLAAHIAERRRAGGGAAGSGPRRGPS
ncbi:MAG TPA: NAD(P)-binding domain-containing protein [Polyangiaceae bacterium]|nr:NAD(P)-binding domain-containing protein [Polyangiaceae bacterium]